MHPAEASVEVCCWHMSLYYNISRTSRYVYLLLSSLNVVHQVCSLRSADLEHVFCVYSLAH